MYTKMPPKQRADALRDIVQAARDAGDASMRAAGSIKWTLADYRAAEITYRRLTKPTGVSMDFEEASDTFPAPSQPNVAR